MTLMAQARAAPGLRRPRRQQEPRHRLAFLGIMPAVVLVVVATFLPMVQAVNLAFRRTHFLQTGSLDGFQNFARLFGSPGMSSGLAQTVVFTLVSVVLALVGGVAVACALAETRHTALWETLLLLPWVVSQLMTGLLWKFLYSPNVGLVDVAWKSVMGHNAADLLGTPRTAMASLIIANVWEILPFAAIIILAALRTVPSELREATAVDGASTLKAYSLVMLPQVRGSILVVTVMLSLHSFNMVQLPLIITGGGPANATNLLGFQVYRDAFVSYDFGLASALAVVMFLVNVVFTVIYVRLLKGRAE